MTSSSSRAERDFSTNSLVQVHPLPVDVAALGCYRDEDLAPVLRAPHALHEPSLPRACRYPRDVGWESMRLRARTCSSARIPRSRSDVEDAELCHAEVELHEVLLEPRWRRFQESTTERQSSTSSSGRLHVRRSRPLPFCGRAWRSQALVSPFLSRPSFAWRCRADSLTTGTGNGSGLGLLQRDRPPCWTGFARAHAEPGGEAPRAL